MDGGATMYPPFDHWFWWLPTFFLGACIGSFLNVVIYRVPRNLSVNKPNRSFCPRCKAPITMRHNLPIVSWLWLRGKCADCGGRISFRYFAVELLTACLFLGVWVAFAPEAVAAIPFLWLLVAFLVAISFIDAEFLIVPLALTWAGSAAGIAAAALWPRLPMLGSAALPGRIDGLIQAGLGWVIGFFGLWSVVLLGKLAFGRKRIEFDEEVEWKVCEPEEEDRPLLFVIDGEENEWWDMFYRPSDRLLIDAAGVKVDGEKIGDGLVTVREGSVELPDGRTVDMEHIASLSGRTRRVTIPREAMGMGDVHLMGMIGAFFGWAGVFFSLFSACVFAIAAAVVGRIGFGVRLPFGPFLALGALVWMFGGWQIWQWYLETLTAVPEPSSFTVLFGLGGLNLLLRRRKI